MVVLGGVTPNDSFVIFFSSLFYPKCTFNLLHSTGKEVSAIIHIFFYILGSNSNKSLPVQRPVIEKHEKL